MKSREDVIKGLECHKRVMYGEIDEHGFACNSCPYKDMESTCRSRTEGDLISDALTLLKAQEPRVLTLREWISTPEPADGECMCYEIKNKGLQAMLVKAFDGVRHLYGKAFRVWTSRPDNATREATPWE